MRVVFLITLFALTSFLSAQITVKDTDLPSSGDTFRFSTTSDLTLNTSSTGANSTWDYSTLNWAGQGVDEYKSFLQTPYLFYSQFWGAIGVKTGDTLGFGLLTITNLHTFYRKRSSSYTAEGTGFTTSGIPLASDYSDADRVYKLPLQYNEHDTDYFRVATTIPALGTFIQQGVRYTHVDGWGKISTPYKKNINCLRIKSDVLETDSLKTQFISFGFPVNRREIKWLSNTEKQAVLEVTGALLGGNFTPATIKYRDSFRSRTNGGGGFGPKANFTVDKTVGVKDVDVFTFTNESTPPQGLTHKWSFTPFKVKYVNGTTNTDQDVDVVFLDTGWFSVKLTATEGANSVDTFSTNLINISETSSTSSLAAASIILLPNPVLDYMSITANYREDVKISIYNLQGQLLLNKNIVGESKVDISFLPSARYLLLVEGEKEITKLMFDKY